MSLVRGHSPDGAYFLDCTNPSTGEQKSVVGYYSNIPDGGVSNGQAPDSTAVMTVPQQGFQQWASAGEPERESLISSPSPGRPIRRALAPMNMKLTANARHSM